MPYRVFYRSRLPALVGRLVIRRSFAAVTFGPFIFAPERVIDIHVLVHELRHVWHFWICWIVAALLWLLVRPSWLWLAVTPFAYSIAYALAGFYAMARGRTFYRANWFEVDARRRAGEPIE